MFIEKIDKKSNDYLLTVNVNNGIITVEWITDEISDILCKLCGKCNGINKPLNCITINKFCG